MKKLFTILCAAALLLAAPMTVFAEDVEVHEPGTTNVQLTASATSTYSVKIPQVVDVTALSTTLTVYAKGDIAANEQLSISYNGAGLQLVDQTNGSNKANIDLSFAGDAALLNWDDIDDPEYINNDSMVVTITHAAISSGVWSATLPIVIALNTITV